MLRFKTTKTAKHVMTVYLENSGCGLLIHFKGSFFQAAFVRLRLFQLWSASTATLKTGWWFADALLRCLLVRWEPGPRLHITWCPGVSDVSIDTLSADVEVCTPRIDVEKLKSSLPFFYWSKVSNTQIRDILFHLFLKRKMVSKIKEPEEL